MEKYRTERDIGVEYVGFGAESGVARGSAAKGGNVVSFWKLGKRGISVLIGSSRSKF